MSGSELLLFVSLLFMERLSKKVMTLYSLKGYLSLESSGPLLNFCVWANCT